MRSRRVIAALACCGVLQTSAADVFLSEGTNISVDVATDGRLATDLLGGIWVVPSGGGEAESVASGLRPAARPRWSPGDDMLVYESSTSRGSSLWLYSFADGLSQPLGDTQYSDQQPDWHPDGERVVFSSARRDSDFDIWEIDVATQLAWRLTSLPGNETAPAWSTNGRDLVYVHEHDRHWSLMLRRRGAADEAVVQSDTPLAAPSWRPDGSLVTYLQRGDEGWNVRMAILSEPRLDRPLIQTEDLFLSPVTWLDRQRMIYAANGQILKRNFNSWTSVGVPFRARVGRAGTAAASAPTLRDLPDIDEPAARTVVRAARLFDGIGGGYRENVDIVIEGGRIKSVSPRIEHGDAIVIDLGDVTVLPGFIDAYADLPGDVDPSHGPLLLSFGVTTLVAENDRSQDLTATWSGKAVPGPRVLESLPVAAQPDGPLPWLVTISGDMTTGVAERQRVADWQGRGVAVLADGWQVALGSGATLLLGTDTRPSSPGGRRYQDVQLASGAGELTFVSGLADQMTPGVDAIWQTRQAPMLAAPTELPRRFTATPNLAAAASTLVVGSRPNGLPPGIALHAELRALIAAGLSGEQALRAVGVNAASALGLGIRAGRVATGSVADLVIVDGDPLTDITDALNIVAVVRNGRFFSVSGLIDRAVSAKNVE